MAIYPPTDINGRLICALGVRQVGLRTLLPLCPHYVTHLTAPSKDRDSAKWGLGPETVERRRNLFWEVVLFENVHVRSQTVSVGRGANSRLSATSLAVPRVFPKFI